jgi:hypothetical protein
VSKRSRNKPYVPRSHGARTLRTQPWKLRGVFQPLDDILTQMEETGYSDADQTGLPVFRSMKDGGWYGISEAIAGVADAYEIHASRSGRPMPVEALRRVATKLHYGTVLFQDEVDAMRAAMEVLRKETMNMTEDYAASLLQGVRIKVELERANP